jgi:iron(III) transport system ATP-binding protein
VSAGGIRLEAVSKQFIHRVKGPVYAVREVTLDVAPGKLVTLLGPSGCGKTTTLRMIAGFESPDAGRIVIGGQDVTRVMVNERGIGFVFQNYALFPHLSVFENVAYGLRVRKEPAREVARRVGEVLALVGLAGYERQQPHQLSGGEQQRVALARAIVIRPRVLLFDEPLSNLDATLRVAMRAEIQSLQQALSITAVYVTHDQEEAMAISDRIAVMDAGRIVQEGTAEELYASPASEFVARFIGRTNLLSGHVLAASGSRVEVEALGRRFTVPAAGIAPSAGTAVRLVVRPETIELAEPGTAATAPGVVLSRTFLGEKAEYRVKVGEETLHVTGYSPLRQGLLAPGEAVDVRIQGESVRILPGAAG